MSQIALYRRYRPQRFEDVLGQEHVSETLQAAIRERRVGHAYLFSGSRGTGKTSTARILAKALNCERGPTPSPCNECDTCRAITEGNSLDVIEIDAASHGGVDDVRELRDNSVLAPASARTKIYIVDEAHMVSTQGWNAFLKTVEEPPSHVIFVFATTEPHKVLPTILSRCQRFDFRRVSSSSIAGHLAKVCAEEGIAAEESALQLIARAAEGGVRDALSTLDQLASSGAVTAADAARLLGTTTGDVLFEFANAIASSDTGSAMRVIARLVQEGQDLRVFCRSFVDHVRALLVTRHVDDPGDLLDVTDETRAHYAQQADRFPVSKLVHVLRLFVDALSEMRQQAAPRMTVELAAVRATLPKADETATAALARIERLERLLELGHTPPTSETPAPEAPASEAPASQTPAPPKQAAPGPKQGPSATIDLEKIRRDWALVLENVRTSSRKLHALIGDASVLSFDGSKLTLECRFPFHAEQLMDPKNARVFSEAFATVFGASPSIEATVRVDESDGDVVDINETIAAPREDPREVLEAAFGDIVEE